MKVTAFYYLDYPDSCPVDLSYASTKMYVEVGRDKDTISSFGYTYAFQVYTMKYVQDNYFDKQLPLIGRSILIVAELNDAVISEFLNANISNLEKWGEVIGIVE